MNQEEIDFCKQVSIMGTEAGKHHTFEYVEAILREGIPGDFVECGVCSGGHEAIASYVFKKWGVTDRRIHLFDSFQGVPKASQKDCEDVQKTYGLETPGKLESSGKCLSGISNIYGLFDQYKVTTEYLIFHPGWFQDVMEGEAKKIGPIAFLRIDVDLYESTKLCYQHLYGKVVPGGVVVDDDWGAPQDNPACRQAVRSLGYPADGVNVYSIPGYETTAYWRMPK